MSSGTWESNVRHDWGNRRKFAAQNSSLQEDHHQYYMHRGWIVQSWKGDALYTVIYDGAWTLEPVRRLVSVDSTSLGCNEKRVKKKKKGEERKAG